MGKKTLSNFECGDDLKTILVTLMMPFDFCNSTQYYEDGDFTNSPFTLLKMQIFICDLTNKERLEKNIMWSRGVGFGYPIQIDLINESFEILPATSLHVPIGTKNKTKRNGENEI